MIKQGSPKEPQCVFLTDPHYLIVQKTGTMFLHVAKETYLLH